MSNAAIARLIFDELVTDPSLPRPVSNKEAKRILARRFDLLVLHPITKNTMPIWPEFVDLMDECFPT